jgi:hypothetical protein
MDQENLSKNIKKQLASKFIMKKQQNPLNDLGDDFFHSD